MPIEPKQEDWDAARKLPSWDCDCDMDNETTAALAQARAEGEAAGMERAAMIAHERMTLASDASDWWAAARQGVTAGFAQIRQHEARDCRDAIRAAAKGAP